jgi:hypothetical protein
MNQPNAARRSRTAVLVLTVAAAAAIVALDLAAHEPPRPSAATAAQPFLKGMTITCPRFGQIWGTEHMAQAIREVRDLGVEWIAIHPYIHIQSDGTLLFRRPAQETEYLVKAVEIAHREGVEFFWKPHLSYWGSFEWRGAITFTDEAAWQRFFTGYRRFIVDQARFAEAHRLPLFAVGVELEGTTHRPEWRGILDEVRQVYGGRITYAANWDQLAKVPFWDRLDVIGVQAYFPLSGEESPTPQALAQGWDRHLDELRALSASLGGKPVLFTEIGYNPAPNAAREPWDYHVDNTPRSRQLRRQLMDVALQRLPQEPFLMGLFWWKWMPGAHAGRSDFSMRDPEAKAALREAWGKPNPPRLTTPR